MPGQPTAKPEVGGEDFGPVALGRKLGASAADRTLAAGSTAGAALSSDQQRQNACMRMGRIRSTNSFRTRPRAALIETGRMPFRARLMPGAALRSGETYASGATASSSGSSRIPSR